MMMQLCETKTFLSFLMYFSQGLMGFHEELWVFEFVDADSSSKDTVIYFCDIFVYLLTFFNSNCSH